MDLFNLRAVIGLDTSEYERGIKSSSGLFTKVGRGFKTTAKAIGKTVAVGVGAGAAAFAALAKASLDAHGELEQNIGGSEAVFKEFADLIQGEGAEAYKNLGLSQSDYLATANKMGALLQGSGYSIAESFDLTTEVMQRAADVASIMGLDTSAAMEAIAGAAKGNFTMMDNLGVAINDAALAEYALSQGITKSTQEMTTQEKVGLAMELFLENTAYAAGNYARENETLAGSLSTAKAAFDNFLSGAGTAEQLVDAVLGSAQVVITNLSTLLPALAEGIGSLIAGLAPMLPDLIAQLLPALVSGAALLVSGLLANAPALASAIVTGIYDGIILALPVLADAGASMLSTILTAVTGDEVSAEEIKEYFTTIWDTVSAAASNLIATLETLSPLIAGVIAAVVAFKTAMDITTLATNATSLLSNIKTAFAGLNAVMLANPIALVVAAIAGLVAAFAVLWNKSEAFRQFWINLWNTIKSFVINAWNNIKDGVGRAIETVSNTVTTVFNNVKEFVSTVWNNIKLAIDLAWNNIKNGVSTAINSVKSTISTVFNTVKTAVSNVWNGIKDTITGVWDTIYSKVGIAIYKVWSIVSTIFYSVKDTVTTVWDGIKTAIQTPIESARDLVSAAIESIKGFFDFDFSWPDLKLPHFKFSGSWNPFDWPEEFPSIGVEWYNKAMNNPMLLRGATIFGMQDGRMLGGGDAGGEIVAGANTVVQMITDAVHSALSSGNLGGVVVNQNIYSEAKTAADLMQEARWEAERAVLTSV